MLAGGGDQREGIAEDVVGDARVPDGDLDGNHLAGDSTGSSCSIGWCSNWERTICSSEAPST